MHRPGAKLFVSLVVTGLVATGCDAPPTAPAVDQVSVAPSATVMSARGDFQFQANIPAPSPCLGGIFRITGTITGWFQDVVDPNGRGHTIEHLDFSNLTGTFDGRTWQSQPGSVEIWSVHISPPGDAASLVVHEGRTRFVADDDADPNILFVHRIHQLRLPSGEIQLNNVTGGAFCVGAGD
jgi:hypothetical protein